MTTCICSDYSALKSSVVFRLKDLFVGLQFLLALNTLKLFLDVRLLFLALLSVDLLWANLSPVCMVEGACRLLRALLVETFHVIVDQARVVLVANRLHVAEVLHSHVAQGLRIGFSWLLRFFLHRMQFKL